MAPAALLHDARSPHASGSSNGCWLVAYDEADEPRRPGALKGQIWIADDFDELPPEILAAFEGEPE